MRFCNHCGRYTAGKPLYCTFCGRSYDVRLCPRKHVNPRYAELCSQCGSRELSTPHPRIPIRWRILLLMVQGAVAVLFGITAIALLVILPPKLPILPRFFSLAALLGLFSFVFSSLPEWFHKAIRRSMRRQI